MNLCRMKQKVLLVDDLYGVDGKLCSSAEEMNQGVSQIKWPLTPIPKTWEKWWWEELKEWFPQEKGK